MTRGLLAGLTIAVTAAASAQAQRPAVRLAPEAAGWDAVLNGLLSAFDASDVVALGEAHGRGVDSELRLRLVRHADFAKRAPVIVVEFANAFYQPLLDRFLSGEDVPLADARQAWENPTAGPAARSPAYEQFFVAVREINRALPDGRRVRVLAGDPPRDWSHEQTPDDRARYVAARTPFAVSIVRDRVLAAGRKALLLYGSGHVWHRDADVTGGIERVAPGRVFVAETLAPVARAQPRLALSDLDRALGALEATVRSAARPVLVSLRGTPAAALAANPFYLGEAMLAPTVTLGDLDDACIYFGRSPEIGQPAK